MIFISLKVKGQISYKNKLKIYFLQIYHLAEKIFLDMNSYNSNRGAKRSSIVFPPIFMLLVWLYMHDTL